MTHTQTVTLGLTADHLHQTAALCKTHTEAGRVAEAYRLAMATLDQAAGIMYGLLDADVPAEATA